jgi:hypothetical protein
MRKKIRKTRREDKGNRAVRMKGIIVWLMVSTNKAG